MNESSLRRPRKRPETVAEHKAEAQRLVAVSFGPAGIGHYGEELLRRARHHAEAARILQALEDLHR